MLIKRHGTSAPSRSTVASVKTAKNIICVPKFHHDPLKGIQPDGSPNRINRPDSTVDCSLKVRVVQGSNPGWVIPMTLKMVPDAPLIGVQHYKVKM